MNAFRLLETSRHGARSPTAEHAPKVDARGLRHQGTRAAPVRPAMLGLGIALALAGCASLAPDYERPPLPVPDQYAEAAAAAATTITTATAAETTSTWLHWTSFVHY